MIAGRFGEAADRAASMASSAEDESVQRLFAIARAAAEIQTSATPEAAIPLAEETLAWARANDVTLVRGVAAHTLAIARSTFHAGRRS